MHFLWRAEGVRGSDCEGLSRRMSHFLEEGILFMSDCITYWGTEPLLLLRLLVEMASDATSTEKDSESPHCEAGQINKTLSSIFQRWYLITQSQLRPNLVLQTVSLHIRGLSHCSPWGSWALKIILMSCKKADSGEFSEILVSSGQSCYLQCLFWLFSNATLSFPEIFSPAWTGFGDHKIPN